LDSKPQNPLMPDFESVVLTCWTINASWLICL